MSSISMIDRVKFPEDAGTDTLEMKVGGPLDLDRREQYAAPITIKFVIIQSPERPVGETEEEAEQSHTPDEDHRIRGSVEVDPNATRWEATVRLTRAEFLEPRGARGIAMAVMEKADGYAFETLTWCDFMLLPKFVPGASSQLVDAGTATSRGGRRWETSGYPEASTQPV